MDIIIKRLDSKSIIKYFFLLSMIFLTLGVVAQNKNKLDVSTLKNLYKIWQIDTSQFSLSPELKPDSNHSKYGFSQNDFYKFYVLPKTYSLKALMPRYNLKMPVIGMNPLYNLNMPIYVPDSSVYYYIKEKHIPFINPQERRAIPKK